MRTLAGDVGGTVSWLDNLGGWEMLLIVLVGLFIFGPDRLPKAIGEGIRMLRQLRSMARNATGDLSKELGTTIELEDLNPQTFIRKHILSEEDERAIRKPLESVYSTLRDDLREVNHTARDVTDAFNAKPKAKNTSKVTPKVTSKVTPKAPPKVVPKQSSSTPEPATVSVQKTPVEPSPPETQQTSSDRSSIHVDFDAT